MRHGIRLFSVFSVIFPTLLFISKVDAASLYNFQPVKNTISQSNPYSKATAPKSNFSLYSSTPAPATKFKYLPAPSLTPSFTTREAYPESPTTPAIVLPQTSKSLGVFSSSRNGLIPSFTGDSSQSTIAHTYDQAIAVKFFLLNNNSAAASDILNYYLTIRNYYKMTDAGKNSPGAAFFKSYAVSDPIHRKTEDNMRTGENSWLGIAALHYSQYTKSSTYMPLATDIADYLVDLNSKNSGGPGLLQDPSMNPTVKSTEENIDAYVFLKQLGAKTGNSRYKDTANSIKSYIESMINKSTGYFNTGSSGNTADTRFMTDVQAMAILAFRKDGLEAMKIDVKSFVDAIERNGIVKDIKYTKASGETITVTGFGFTANDDKISPEWTAQMVIAYLVLADDYRKDGDQAQADYYKGQALFFINQLAKMVDDTGNLPYATKQNAPIVAEWSLNTPTGTQALCATTYYQLALAGDNPYTTEIEHLWE